MVAEKLLTGVLSRGEELWAHCPFHSESTPGGAFSYNPETDVAKCFSCGEGGDLIRLFCAVRGYDLDSKEGFKAFREEYAANVSDPPLDVLPERRKQQEWEPKKVTSAPVSWHEGAGRFVKNSCERLLKNRDVLSQLAALGISRETAELCKLGWNDKDKSVPRAAWGLPEILNKQTGKPKKIWLPEGLVLPMFDAGQVVKIKIRRPQEETSWGAKLRYWEVPGGENNRFHRYGKIDWKIWVLVETERDAVLVWQHVRQLRIGAMGTGGAAKRPSNLDAEILRNADVILLALDGDAAGIENSWKFWIQEFPQSLRWSVPQSMGKDIGDAVRDHGLDVLAWVRSGLPGYVLRRIDREVDAAQKSIPKKVVPEKSADDLPEYVSELAGILTSYPIRANVKTGVPQVNQNWAKAVPERWEIFRRAAWLLSTKEIRVFLGNCSHEILDRSSVQTEIQAQFGEAGGNEQGQDVAVAGINELFELLQRGPLWIDRKQQRLEHDIKWGRQQENWNIICRISNELMMDSAVLDWIDCHPDSIIRAENFWKTPTQ